MMRRLLFPLLALALAGLSFGQAPQKQTTINIWGVNQSPDNKGQADAIKEFERRNPDIRVRLLSMGAGGMNPQKLMTAIVGGVPPDVIYQDRFTISDWAARGAFLSLDELIDRDKATDPLTPTEDQYYPSVWAEAMYDGKVYGIPWGADNRMLYWNRETFRKNADALRAAGLDPERAPRTWSETLAYSKVLTKFDEKGNIQQVGFLPNFGNSWLYMFGFQMNASFLSPDGSKATLNTPEARKALQYMIDGYEIAGGFSQADRFQSTFRGAENDPFLAGQVAMIINGDWMLRGYFRYRPDLDFEVAPPPVPDDRFLKRGAFANEKDTYITWAGGFSWAIPRGARHTEAAWRFIKFLTSFEGRKVDMDSQNRFERQRGRRYIPGISGLRAANEYAIANFAKGDSSYDKAFIGHAQMMEYARIRPATFAAQALWDAHVRAADRAIRKLDPPEKALQEGQDTVQRILDEVLAKDKYPEINLNIPIVLGVGAVLACVIAGVVLIWRQKLGPLRKVETAWGYLFISPWIFGFLIFTLGPMVASLFFSFTQYNVLTEARWVGLKNYSDLLQNDTDLLLKAFFNVFYLAAVGMPIGLTIGLAVALLLNQDIKGMRFYRTVYYLPAVVPGVVGIILWMWIMNADPNRGILNSFWQATISQWFGGSPPNWFGDAYWTKPAIITMGLWGAGAGMILWLAGLKGIPKTLYEAASIDGASPKQQFWSITIPMLSPIIFFSVVMGLIGSVQAFDNVYIITGGQGAGPNDSLLVPVYHLFTNGFTYFRMGYASALAWVIFAVVLIITFIQFKLSPMWVHTESAK